MGVLHGDAGIDLKPQFNYWTIKIQTCLTTWMITNVLLSIFIYTLCILFFFPVPCVENDMPYCNYILYFYILSWWPYDSGKPIPVLIRSPWDKVDLSGFADKIP